jgi:transposase-like protein
MEREGTRRRSIRPLYEHVFVAYPAYVRDKARQMRLESGLTIDELAERLAISRQTIYYWVRDLPIEREPRWNPHGGAAAVKTKYQVRREAAYARGLDEFDELARAATFRDFVCMYIGEGYKRNRNRVSIGNSDPRVVTLAARWIRRFSANRVSYWVQYHADQDLAELAAFWAAELRVEPSDIRLQRKSNSGQLAGRNWRSRYGVLTVLADDTLFRARLQAWIDRVKAEWIDWAYGA